MFQTLIIIPLSNALIFLTNTFFGNIGLAVIALTLIVKFVLYPFSLSTIKSQAALKKIQPLIDDIKKKYTDKNEQAVKTMELYKEHKANPLTGCLPLIIQLPIVIGLYQVFLRGDASFNPEIMYSFVHLPETISHMFLGVDLSVKSALFALFAGIAQYVQLYYSPIQNKKGEIKEKSIDPQALMMENMQKNLRYILPVMIMVFMFFTPAAIALYLIVSSLFTLVQEIVIARKLQSTE